MWANSCHPDWHYAKGVKGHLSDSPTSSNSALACLHNPRPLNRPSQELMVGASFGGEIDLGPLPALTRTVNSIADLLVCWALGRYLHAVSHLILTAALRFFQAVCPQVSYSTSQSLSFFICKGERKTYFIGSLCGLNEIMRLTCHAHSWGARNDRSWGVRSKQI